MSPIVIRNWKGHARGKHPGLGVMNKLEEQYATEVLWKRKLAGDVLWWAHDSLKLRLAQNTFYTPDFLVLTSSLALEIHEVKGFWEEDARVKIKVAADKFPFRFLAAKRIKGVWEYEDFAGGGEENAEPTIQR